VTLIRSTDAQLELSKVTLLCSHVKDECTPLYVDSGKVSMRQITVEVRTSPCFALFDIRLISVLLLSFL
jgi:hypothetical protein